MISNTAELLTSQGSLENRLADSQILLPVLTGTIWKSTDQEQSLHFARLCGWTQHSPRVLQQKTSISPLLPTSHETPSAVPQPEAQRSARRGGSKAETKAKCQQMWQNEELKPRHSFIMPAVMCCSSLECSLTALSQRRLIKSCCLVLSLNNN